MTAARGRARARGERQAPRDGDIAIVGIAGRFAGAADIAEFTQAALAGRSLLGPPPDDRFEWHTPPNAAMHQGAGGYMADIDRFDAGIFGIGEREAARMDPQARLFLEAARGAFEDAGHAPRGLAGTEVGVFVAYTFQDWLQRLRRDDRVGRLRLTDVIAGALATRVSRAFDLRGPSEVFNAACAGSLLAVHRAAMAIRAGECEAALAGGVNLILSGDGFAMEARAGMLARGDESLALDRAASGFLRGEGVGAVLLKTVARARADRDAIRAIIRGSAAGHSGTSGVMSAADAARQGAIVARALRAAAVEPATLGHVELQCAGRPAEDAAELAVIAAGFHAASGTDTPADRLPAIGCLKPVAGHMEAASGIAQLAKTVALLSSAEIPAMPLLRDPSPLVVAAWPGFARAVGGGPWPEGRSQRRASISGFGFGGHHVHMVVEAPPQRPDAAAAMTERAFLLSAPDRDRLVRTASSLAAALDGAGHSAADVALTLLVGRDAMSERLAILASDLPELVSRLRAFVAAPESTGPWVRGRAAVSPPLLGTASEDREWLSAMVSGGRWRRLADLWASGLDFDWTAVAATLPGARVSLPAMALAQTRWWLDDAKPAVTPVAQPASVPPARTEQSRVGLLRELLAETLGIADATTLSMADGPVAVGLDSMAAMELRSRIADAGGPPPSLAAILAAPSLAVLAALMPERAEATPAIAADVAARGEPFPLTDIQLSYLLGRQGFSAGGGFGCQVHWMFARPRFQPQRLAAAIDRLVERHEMLRAVFGEDATQRILPVEQVPMCAVPVHDLTGLAPDEAVEQRAGVERRFRDEGFDPARPPLFRFAIVRDRAGDVLHFACDLIVADGPSLFLLLDELATLYDAPDAALPPIGFSFRDYVLEQRRRAPALAAARDYWAARLDRLPGPPALPVLPGDPTGVGFTRLSALLERAGWAAFQRHASAHGLTAVGAVMTAFAQSLAAWAEAPEFCLNVTLATRRAMHPDVFRLVADFTGNVLLAIPPRDGSSFADHARAIARQLAADAERAEHSAVQVMAALSGRRRSPVAMPVVFTALLGYATLLKRPVAIDAIGRYLGGATRTPQVWLDAQALEAEEGLHLSWDLREGVLAPDVASNMFAGFMAHVRRLAEDAAAWDEPAAPASDAADLAPRRAANATAARLPREPIFAGILRQAGARPEVEALVAADRRLTFAALADEATAAARSLVAQGLRSGDLVAVVMPKGWRQIVAALATVLAGGAYVPIELPAPAARIRDLVERAGARFALVHEAPLLDWPCTAHRLDRLPPAPEASLPEVAAGDLAYIIYTSGSTGTPKGVAMAHDAVSNTLHDVNGRFAVGPGDRVLGLSSLGFDLSVWDIFGVLGAGGALVLPAPESLRDPAHLSALATGEGVTLWNTTPAYLKLMMEAPGATLPATLRLAMLSGDWIPLGLARRMLAEHPGVRLVSLGGATEAAIWSIWHPIDRVEADWTSIPYGRPLANQRFHVLDEGMASVPTGEIGQLHIAGAGLAEGYWRDPDRTAESFIRHPETGERLYRTGDYGRYLPDGAIEFLGRRDAQVKIGGHRIELAEVEAALMRLPGIAEAVALPIDDAGGNRRLAAAYRTDGGVTPEVRGTLAEILPSYMIPAVLLAVDRMPLTANGKVDRRALADRAAERLAGARPPQAQAAARLVSPPATARDPDRFVAEMMASAGVLQDEAARCAFVASARGTRRDLGHLPAVALPPAPPRENGPERRSVRRFAVGPLSRERLSALLAPLQSMPTAEGTRRRYASAGSTYAVQVYLVVARGGVEAGLWHYDADAHRLSRLGECPVSPASLHVATNRPMAAAAAVTILLIGDLAAIRPIYGELAPDLMRVEAGGIGHLLEETAAGLGIGLCAVGWLDMAPIAAVLRLTPDHMLVHALVAGEPATVAPHVVASGPDPELRDLVRGAWRRVLGHDDFADDASFFEVGGNSFLAVALQTDLAGRLAAPPSVTDLFRHPTVAALARHLGGGGPAAPVPATPAPTPVAPFDPLAERRSRRLAARLNGGSHPVYAAGE